ncbi:DUF707 domain-containing protein [Fictibacillus sp. NPDC058756]|uniref:DUF707 domain-containing protein n=1 Tax=Fictibacillus sp. NPDC058756 TaxID=3346625 RepID=UPI0036A300AE
MKLINNNSINRFLVVAVIGDHASHYEWIKPSEYKNFDLCIIYNGDYTGGLKDDCNFYFEKKGAKWPAIKEIIKELGEQINKYDAIWFPDEEILTNAYTINRMFEIFNNQNFEIAQPALTNDSYYSHHTTLQHSFYLWRYSSFVEITAPIFSQNALKLCWNTFDLNQSGWGLDLLWPKIINNPYKRIGIIDETPVTYIRKGPSLYNRSFYKDLEVIEKQFDVSAATYSQTHYDGMLMERNVFVIVLAHKDEKVLEEQIKNIRHFIPEAGIILYNGGNNPDFAKSLKIPIYPYSRPVQWSRSARVYWDVMRWLEDMDVNYKYLVNFDHDMLFIKHGFEEFLDESMKDFDCMGWQLFKGTEIEKYPAPVVPQSLWNEWEIWQPIFQTNDFLRYFNPGQVYRRGIIQQMLRYLQTIDDEKLSNLFDKTHVHTLDEMFYVTLVMACGGKYREYPDGHQYNEAVRWGENITLKELRIVQNNPSYYWIHPIKDKKLVKMNKWLLFSAGSTEKSTSEQIEVVNTGKEIRKERKKRRKREKEKKRSIKRSRECNCHDYQNLMIGNNEVLDLIKLAAQKKEAFSLTRFSHAEISYLNWEINPLLIKNYEEYRAYSGITGSTEAVAEKLLNSMNSTDIVGFVPINCKDNGEWWYTNTKKFLHHINRIPEKICSVWVSQEIIYNNEFWDFLKQNRVALIGRRAEEAVPNFTKKGVQLTVVKSLEGIDEIDSVHEYMKYNKNWDIALISAAIPATILTPLLAKDSGRVVIDFGHAMDMVIEEDRYNFYKYLKEWNSKKH